MRVQKIVDCATNNFHCMKSVQIRSYFWSVFSSIRTEYGPEISLYLDTFHAVLITTILCTITALSAAYSRFTSAVSHSLDSIIKTMSLNVKL